jgi:hypothetical protein
LARQDVADTDEARGGGVATPIGLLLIPIAAVLLLVELERGGYWLQHFLARSDTSLNRKVWESVVSLVVGLVGPACVGLVWFDVLKTNMSNRLRLALVGYVGCAVAGMAVLIFIPLGSYISFT